MLLSGGNEQVDYVSRINMLAAAYVEVKCLVERVEGGME